VGEENVKKILRKDIFAGIFASTVSLSIFGWLGNPHGNPHDDVLEAFLHRRFPIYFRMVGESP
jgi:hypothetical protein